MDAPALLRAKIPNFPGYGDDQARRLSDELVRAYSGELLSDLQNRIGATGATADRLTKVLLRCEFLNQIAFKPYENADLDETKMESMASADLQLVDLAEKSSTLDGSSLDTYLDEVESALDLRDHEMETAPA